MNALLITSAAFVLPLMFYSPQPESLREVARESFMTRVKLRRGTLGLGVLLILIAAATFDTGGFSIRPISEALFGQSRYGVIENGWVFQLLTNGFVHINLLHLAGNLSILMLLSVYEWRVGTRRFLTVFLVAVVACSLVDLAVLPADTVSLGASGGICGLAAAYFVDYKNVSRKEWITGTVTILAVIGAYSFFGNLDQAKLGGSVNWIAHLAGAVAGGIYVRIFQIANDNSSPELAIASEHQTNRV